MKLTQGLPNVPLEAFKRTKIIATVGPATDSYEAVRDLIKEGANGLRLNFSHGDHAEHGQRIKWIRKASEELGKPVAIIQDLQGPKIRLGDFEGVVEVQAGDHLKFGYKTDYAATGCLPTQYDLSKKVKRGERLYLFDGKVRTVVTRVADGVVHAEVENAGMLIKRKGINLPDTDFAGDVITAKDKADLLFGSTQDIDYVAQSFVQSANDVRDMRRLMKNLNMNAKIIVKLETKAAVEDMEAIVEETDALMVARGDLAVEMEPEAVPVVQRQLIGLCQQQAKPVVVATQMLFSMTHAPSPTRAEISDVATAVILGTDAVMLSDETASGQYPLEAVQTMKRVITYTQSHNPVTVGFSPHEDHSRQAAISKAILSLADTIQAKAIVAETKSGATALQIASYRSEIPLIAVTSDVRTAQQLAIVYGAKSYIRPVDTHAASKLTDWLRKNKVLHSGDIVVTASGQHPGIVGTTDTIKVRVLK
ncbi:MAG TPA: pyruvate kinase [Candidatus Saccharimonadales bacterium]